MLWFCSVLCCFFTTIHCIEVNFYLLPQAANVQQCLKEIKASNQQAQFLGNKVEMAITHALEKNKSMLKIGLHFEFGDCRCVTKERDRERQQITTSIVFTGIALPYSSRRTSTAFG